jgi:hypothetical protein
MVVLLVSGAVGYVDACAIAKGGASSIADCDWLLEEY